MHAAKIILTGLAVLMLSSCRTHPTTTSDNPNLLREQAIAKRVHAAGLRHDMREIDYMIADLIDAGDTIDELIHKLHELNETVQHLSTRIGELRAHQAQLPRQEAREMETEVIRHWQGRLYEALKQHVALWDKLRTLSKDSLASLQHRLNELDENISHQKAHVEELESERERMTTYEAYLNRRTLQRHRSRLDTVQNQRDALNSRIRALRVQIREHENAQESNLYRANRLDIQAAELDRLAAQIEARGPLPEPDFWSMW